MDADKSCRGPLLLEGGERDAHEVRAGGGVQPRVVTLGLDPADVAAGDEAGDPAELDRILAKGAERATEVASRTRNAVYDAVGVLPPAGGY